MASEVMELTPEMKAAIGKSGAPASWEVTTLGIRTFARSLGYENPIYYDEDAAKQQGHPGLVAPPGYYGMPVWNPGGGSARDSFFTSPFTRNLNGGTAVVPLERVYAGDILDAVTTLTDVAIVPSKAYGQMMIRKTETVYTRRSDGTVVGKTRGTSISY